MQKSKIERTSISDRSGRRVRFYKRKTFGRPGTQERRAKAKLGLRWCRGCNDWLSCELVGIRGVCKTHANEEYRKNYAGNGGPEIRECKRARRRRMERVSPRTRQLVMESSFGLCVYCSKPATTIDHIIAVKNGGSSRRGNLVGACSSCNSRKRTKSLEKFLVVCEWPNYDAIVNEIVMEYVN